MPRRHWFTVKVCYDGAIEDFKFMTNGRFPFHSDVNGRIRRQWNISNNIPIFWEQVLYFPDASSRSKIMMKRFVCDAREYEDSQKPFLRLNNKNAAMGFSVVLGTDTFEEAEIIKTRHEGKELLKALKNLTIEHDKLKNLSIKDAEYISECEQKIKEATSAGNQEEVSRWSIHLSLHQKANEANLVKLAACNSERSEISKKLDARTLRYPTFRLFLESQDLLDAEITEETKEHVDYEYDNPTSGRSVSPEPDTDFPPLEHIFSGIRRAPPRHEVFGELPPITGPPLDEESMKKIDKNRGLYRERERFLAGPSFLPPAPKATAPGPSRYDAQGQPIIPRQTNLASSLEAFATHILPEDLRTHMGNFTPTINSLQDHLDAPYQHFCHAKDVVQNAVRDLRNLPPQRPTREELWRMNTPRYMLWDDPNPPAHYMRPIWDNPLLYGPGAYSPSELPSDPDPPRAWIPGYNTGRTPQPAPVKPQPLTWTCQYRHEHISCDGCNEGIKGMRFKCKDCADYDLCSSCLLKNQSSKVHPIEHTFNTIIHRDLERHLNKERTQEVVVPEEHPASCDLCHKRIRGIRTKCTDCPDWDCCETCLPKLGNRHPGHTLVKINLASDLVEPPFRHQKVKHTNIICDMCQGTVVGDRWKCVHPDCNDYDLCNNCHASPLNTHPREHPILKLSVPTNIDYASRFLRNGAKIGDHLPRRYCDFGHREPYTPLTKEEREELKTRWTCEHHSTFELCEKSRIYHASKGALENSSEGTQPEAGPSNSVDIDQPLGSKAFTDTDQHFESKPPTDMDEFAPGSHPDLIKRHEFPPSFAICPAKYDEDRCITPTIDSSLDTAAVDEFAPGSHPDIIKCYIYPPAFAICPAKYEEDRCTTPTIDPSLDTETPTINPSIDTESPTNSPVVDITTPSNDAIFTGVKDITIPAGCSLPVGAEFTKTWSMKHLVSGHEYKFDQLRLVHESGGLLGEACNIQLAFTQDEIKTGEKVEVSIAGLKVPDLPEQQVVEQWRFRDVDGTAYGEPLRLRFTVENPSLQNSLCNSSFIMPPPDHSAPRPTEAQAREPSRASTSVASTPTTSQSYSSLVSLSTNADEEFALIDRVSSHLSIAPTEMTDDALASEFDFVDESEDARSQA